MLFYVQDGAHQVARKRARPVRCCRTAKKRAGPVSARSPLARQAAEARKVLLCGQEARQRPKPVSAASPSGAVVAARRCCSRRKKVLLCGQEAAEARQVLLQEQEDAAYGQEAPTRETLQ